MTDAPAPTLVSDHSSGGIRVALRDAAPLLLGIALLMAGNGLTSTLVGIRAGIEGFSPTVVGVVLAGYYLGFLLGSLVAPSTIARVGHIRVFAGLASLASVSVLVHLVRAEPVTWFLLRAVSGVCLSALYVVCETWLNGTATNRSRGTLLATYMAVVSGSLLAGQLLFSLADPAGVASFVLASVLVSMAVVPVSLADLSAPALRDPERLPMRDLVAAAPLAPVAATLSGFVGAAILGGGVVYAADVGLDRLATGAFIGASLVGGAVLQVPVGRWSDRLDRRAVIVATSVLAAGVAVVIAQVGPEHRLGVIALTTVAGGMSSPLYALANAHLNDYLDHRLMVEGGARMVMLNGAGSIAGPILGAAVVGLVGPGALFVTMAAAYVVTAMFALVRMTVRPAVPEQERGEFSPVPVGPGLTATGFEADADDRFPPEEGTIDTDAGTLAYRTQGEGDAVVLLGGFPGRADPWRRVLPALAVDGYRAVSMWPVGDGGRWLDDGDVLAVLRHLALPWASFVGAGDARSLVIGLAAAHPDRVDGTVVAFDAGEDGAGVLPTGAVPAADSGATPDPGDVAGPTVAAAAGHPFLVVTGARWDEPEDLADDIAEALRHR